MYQTDYIMRMIQMLTNTLIKIRGEDFNGALKGLEDAGQEIAGVDIKLISILEDEELVSLLKTSDLYAGRCLMIGKLLNEYAKIHEVKGEISKSENYYAKSLRIYVESILSEELEEPEKYYPEVDELIKKLNHREISNEFGGRLFLYYGFSGKYAKAEDVLFEQIEKGNRKIIHDGILFYDRLLNKPDEELLKGNFSREEVISGQKEILKLKNKLNNH